MKCPLLAAAYIIAQDMGVAKKSECGKEQCAWYREPAQECCIFVLANDLRDLRDTMREIKDKMPHELQFRK